jgi:hypothetical protein
VNLRDKVAGPCRGGVSKRYWVLEIGVRALICFLQYTRVARQTTVTNQKGTSHLVPRVQSQTKNACHQMATMTNKATIFPNTTLNSSRGERRCKTLMSKIRIEFD